jgi:hypothetical protein
MNALFRSLITVAVATLASCRALPPVHPVNGEFAGQALHTSVDSAMARYYVEGYRKAGARVPAWDAALDTMQASLVDDRLPSSSELSQWSREFSTDTAALVLARQLRRQAEAQPLYALYLDELAHDADARATQRFDTGTLFLFVPGWLYRTDTTTGADFARFRTLLADHGARMALAVTDENGTVEHNAALIAQQVRALRASNELASVVLVSASKGGPEAALALSMLRDEPAANAIKAWINVGGLLGGTALADLGLSWPLCWLLQLAVLPNGLRDSSFDGIRSLTPERSTQRASALRLPAHVLVVSYVAVPLSGQLSAIARDGYGRLRALGPNDGLTLITDAIAPGGVTIPEFGADHYLRQPDIDRKTLALARAVMRHLATREAAALELRAP